MSHKVIRPPDIFEGYALARSILRRPVATPEQIDAALDVLDHSSDLNDIDLVQKFRRQIARDALAAERRAALSSEQDTIRARCVAHTNPDRVRPADNGVALIFAALLFAVLLAIGMGFAAQRVWLADISEGME